MHGENPMQHTFLISNETLGEFKGQCQQWDLATNNDFDVTFKEAGEYTFTSQNGIFSEWWGSPLGCRYYRKWFWRTEFKRTCIERLVFDTAKLYCVGHKGYSG